MKSLMVFAPATVSNIGCGFDVMGFALNAPGEDLLVRESDRKGVVISKITGDEGKIPYEIELNTAGMAAKSLLEQYAPDAGIEIEIYKKMGLGSGLGSSAASAVAVVYGINELLGLSLSRSQLLPHAMEGEKVASKAIHADNVAPCLFGGFILIRGYEPIDIVQLPVPDKLYCAIIHPQIEIKTSEARTMLGNTVELKKAISQWGNVGGLIAGLFYNDFDLIGRSIKDYVAEPVRSKLIPGYANIKKAALETGAIGCNISGSGPSMFALCDSANMASEVSLAMGRECRSAGVDCKLYISKINSEGPKIIG